MQNASAAAAPLPRFSPRRLRRVIRSPLMTFFMIGLGIVCGLYRPSLGHALLPLAEVYLNLLKMLTLPFLVSSVIFSITSMIQNPESVKYLGKIALSVVVVSFVAVGVAGLLTLTLGPGHITDPQTRIELGKFINAQGVVSTDLQISLSAPAAVSNDGVGSIFTHLIPSNVFSALSTGDTMQVLLFCLLFGLALGRLPKASAMSLSQGLDAIYRACVKLTGWFIWALPFATFILIADQVASTGTQPLRLVGGFLEVMGLVSMVLILVSTCIIAFRSRRSFWSTVRSCQPLVMVALTTRSTVASMPWIIDLLVGRLRFNAAAIELLVPLQTALLRAGPAYLYTTGTLFIAQLYDHTLSIPELTLVGLVAALMSLTTSGMSGLVILSQMALLCGYLKLPFEAAFVLFAAVDAVWDTFTTVTNVTIVTAAAAAIAPIDVEKPVVADEETVVEVGATPA